MLTMRPSGLKTNADVHEEATTLAAEFNSVTNDSGNSLNSLKSYQDPDAGLYPLADPLGLMDNPLWLMPDGWNFDENLTSGYFRSVGFIQDAQWNLLFHEQVELHEQRLKIKKSALNIILFCLGYRWGLA